MYLDLLAITYLKDLLVAFMHLLACNLQTPYAKNLFNWFASMSLLLVVVLHSSFCFPIPGISVVCFSYHSLRESHKALGFTG